MYMQYKTTNKTQGLGMAKVGLGGDKEEESYVNMT